MLQSAKSMVIVYNLLYKLIEVFPYYYYLQLPIIPSVTMKVKFALYNNEVITNLT